MSEGKAALDVMVSVDAVEAEIMQEAATWADAYVNHATETVAKWRRAGVSEEAIAKRTAEMWEAKNGIFAGWNAGVGGMAASSVNSIQHNFYMAEIADQLDLDNETLWHWVLDAGVAKHCDTCPTHPGQGPLTYDEWVNIGLPGAGMDDCGMNCRCDIIPVDVVEAIG